MSETQNGGASVPRPQADAAAIREALELFAGTGGVVEVRAFGALKSEKGVVSGYYDDLDKCVRDLTSGREPYTARASNVYVTLNKVTPDLLARSANRLKEWANDTTTDAHIIRRHWLFVDADPIRPKGISSTDAQHDAALAKAKAVGKFLRERGWPDPVIADSGNGGHLLYMIDEPSDDAARQVVEDCLYALADRFDDEVVSIDTTTFNSGRIVKLYGTVARKGDHTPERPWRLARVQHLPVRLKSVSRELLEALAAERPKAEPAERPRPVNGNQSASGPFDMQAFINKHGLHTEPGEPFKGGTKWQMDCPFNPDHKCPDAVLYVTAAGAAAFTCSHRSCQGKDWHTLRDLLEPGWREAKAKGQSAFARRRELERIRETVGETAANREGLPVIFINNRHASDIVDDAIRALRLANEPPVVFKRGQSLVRIVRDDSGVPAIVQFQDSALRGRLQRVANFMTYNSDGVSSSPVWCPPSVVAEVLSLGEYPGFPRLETIATAPIVASDGSLITRPGYIEEAAVYYHESDPRLADGIGDTTPNAANVAAAKSLLLDTLLGDFPFKDAASKANALAALLQPFVRPCISGNTQLYVIRAPVQGTGKSLLAETLAGVFKGSVQSSTPCPDRHNDDEWRKLITTALMEGPSHIWFDNLKHRLDSAQLAQALTSQGWKDRLLGANQSVTVPVRCVWMLTGNTIQMDGDFPRRSALIDLDARVDRPEDRDPDKFAVSDLQSFILDERPALIRAVVTLLRLWLESGRPIWKEQPVGSYTAWSRVMGGILDCLGVPGFLSNREELYSKADPEREQWYAFASAWREKFGGDTVGVAQLVEIAAECEIIEDTDRGSKNHLGRKLLAREGQTFKGFAITRGKDRQRAIQYRLQPVQDVNRAMNFGAAGGNVNQVNESESIPPRTQEPVKAPTARDSNLYHSDSLDSPLEAEDETVVDRNSEDTEFDDPFADDGPLSFEIVKLGGNEMLRATLTGDGWTEIGDGETRADAVADLRQTIETQPDDEDARALKLAALDDSLRSGGEFTQGDEG